jgi:hypothetical protein
MLIAYRLMTHFSFSCMSIDVTACGARPRLFTSRLAWLKAGTAALATYQGDSASLFWYSCSFAKCWLLCRNPACCYPSRWRWKAAWMRVIKVLCLKICMPVSDWLCITYIVQEQRRHSEAVVFWRRLLFHVQLLRCTASNRWPADDFWYWHDDDFPTRPATGVILVQCMVLDWGSILNAHAVHPTVSWT